MSRKHAIGTIAIALLLVGTVATPAAAASDTNSDGVLEQIGNYVNSAQEAVSGAIDRVGYVVFGGSEDVQTASDSVDALHDFSEDHGQAIAEYATAYAPENASKTDYDTIRLNLNAGGESTTVFATATIEDGDVESVDVVNATDRSVDLTLTLDEYSTRELPSDLEHVRTHYIEGEESPESIRSFVASKYWGTDGFDGKDSHVRIQEGDA